MTRHLVAILAVRLASVLALWLGSPIVSAAQGRGPLSSITDGQSAHDGETQSGRTSSDAPVGEYPSLHLSGFGNVDFAAQNKSEGPRGFDEGQFILHLASALSPRVNFFGELSLTPRADAGTGSPVAFTSERCELPPVASSSSCCVLPLVASSKRHENGTLSR
jgi:hypothetical protein